MTSTAGATPITYAVSPVLTNDALNTLFATAWPNHATTDFQPNLRHSLAYICAYAEQQLVGFVNLAWDGGKHAFLLDTTVHASYQRQGIGAQLVRQAVYVARMRGVEWLHVDYEPHLDSFYRSCGFRPTVAGLIAVQDE